MVEQPTRTRYVDAVGLSGHTGFPVGTIRVWTSQKRLPHLKIGRKVVYDLEAIDAWLQKQRVEPLPSLGRS